MVLVQWNSQCSTRFCLTCCGITNVLEYGELGNELNRRLKQYNREEELQKTVLVNVYKKRGTGGKRSLNIQIRLTCVALGTGLTSKTSCRNICANFCRKKQVT